MPERALPSQSERRSEVVARALYRHWMAEDYDEFPWTDEVEPSSETVEEAREVAAVAVSALAEHYKADDAAFEQAVAVAARGRLHDLVASLDAEEAP